MEPVCLEPFNNARECLYRSEMKLRLCKNHLDYFEECYHDPVGYKMFMETATAVQKRPKHFFPDIMKREE